MESSGKKIRSTKYYFKCAMTHNDSSLKRIGITYGLEKKLLKKEKNHDEAFEATRRNQREAWLDNVKIDVSCTAFGLR